MLDEIIGMRNNLLSREDWQREKYRQEKKKENMQAVKLQQRAANTEASPLHDSHIQSQVDFLPFCSFPFLFSWFVTLNLSVLGFLSYDSFYIFCNLSLITTLHELNYIIFRVHICLTLHHGCFRYQEGRKQCILLI